jgi:tripartite-type tricarboxylate transporter receptor subunit TctC
MLLNKLHSSKFIGFAAASLLSFAPTWASAQGWTDKQVQVTVGFAAGGGVDILARMLAGEMQKKGMKVIVENRPGAGSSMAAAMVAGRPGDGTSLMMVNDSYSLAPAIYSRLSYNPRKDLAPVIGVAYAPMVVVVPGNSRFKTLGELIAGSKGTLSWGSCGSGTAPHLAGELLNTSFKVSNTHIPYKGCGPVFVDLLGTQLDYGVVTLGGAVQYLNNGRLRALAITSAERSPVVPQVPSVAESGAPGFNMNQYQGLAVPASTPEPLKQQIYQYVAEIVQSKEFQKRLLDLGYTPASESPAEFTKVVHGDLDRYQALAKQLNLKVE